MNVSNPSERRKLQVYQQGSQKAKELLAAGMEFAARKEWKHYPAPEALREELVTRARYLHRGYYCPSLAQHLIIDNSRRGKILHRPTRRSKITHRYYFDADGKLLIAKSHLPDNNIKTEYLLYSDNRITGFAFDAWDTLVGLSEEIYKDGRLTNYFCASCYEHEADHFHLGITDMLIEDYQYGQEGCLEVDWYDMSLPMLEIEDIEDINSILKWHKYHLEWNQDTGSYQLTP